MVPWHRNRNVYQNRLHAIRDCRNIPESEMVELTATQETSLRRVLSPFLWERPQGWDVQDVLDSLVSGITKLCEGTAHVAEFISLHLIEQVDAVHVSANAFSDPFNSGEIMKIFQKMQRGEYAHNRQVPGVIQEKINYVINRVFQDQALSMVRSHKHHLKYNYFRYYRGVLARFVGERCATLSRGRRRTAASIISNACKDRTDNQLLLAQKAVRSAMLLSNFEFRQIIIGSWACGEFFRFRNKGVSYTETLRKMRDLRLHAAFLSQDDEAFHFPLLPQRRLRTSFVTIDSQSVHTIFRKSTGILRKPGGRGIPSAKDVNSLSLVFGFFEDSAIRLPLTEGHEDKRYGIPQLYPFRWASVPDMDMGVASDPNLPFPVLVTTVQTNGLEAKVKTLTLVPKRGDAIAGDVSASEDDGLVQGDIHPVGHYMGMDITTVPQDGVDEDMAEDVSDSAMSIWDNDDGDVGNNFPLHKHRRAKGVDALRLKGYSQIQTVLDPHIDKTGIFRRVDTTVPMNTPYRIICVDPGRIQLVTYASKNVYPGETSDVFRNMYNPGVHKGAYSTFEYQKGAKFISQCQWEQMQRNANPDYDAWVRTMNNFSLKRPHESTNFINAYYASLETRSSELLRHERRLRQFRRSGARKSTLMDIAKFIVYGEVLDYSKPESHQEKMAIKRKNDRAIKRAKEDGMNRFVAFGDAQFGAGTQGPCPKKSLIREIAKLCPVLLISEWCTSAKCHKCHQRIQVFQGRRVICGNEGCDYEGDRDENACGNMGQGAVNLMQGRPHPPHLTRPGRNNEDN